MEWRTLWPGGCDYHQLTSWNSPLQGQNYLTSDHSSWSHLVRLGSTQSGCMIGKWWFAGLLRVGLTPTWWPQLCKLDKDPGICCTAHFKTAYIKFSLMDSQVDFVLKSCVSSHNSYAGTHLYVSQKVQPAILVRESSTQLIRYSLDIFQISYILTTFKGSERLHQGPKFSHYLIDYTIIMFHHRLPQKSKLLYTGDIILLLWHCIILLLHWYNTGSLA